MGQNFTNGFGVPTKSRHKSKVLSFNQKKEDIKVNFKKTLIVFNVILILFLVSLVAASVAIAEDWPTRPITFIIPQSAGGGFDLSARVFTSVASDYFGVPMVVSIRAGGSTVIGTRDVVQARPDGYTFLYAGNHLLALEAFTGLENIPFDPVADLKPVCRLMDWPMVLLVNPDSPWKTFDEFMDYAKENPRKIKAAIAGAMTIVHVPYFEIEKYGDVKFTHVPYDGAGPCNLSVIQGDTDVTFGVTAWAVNAIQDGLLRGLAITGKERHPSLPDIPTLREFGIESDTTLFCGIYAPKDTPDEIVNKFNEYTRELINDLTYKKMMDNLGNIINYLPAEEFSNVILESKQNIQKITGQLDLD